LLVFLSILVTLLRLLVVPGDVGDRRDMVRFLSLMGVSYVLHVMDRDEVNTKDLQYHPAVMEDVAGVTTNSRWLADYTRKIVPFFEYENVRSMGIYPRSVLFVPYRGRDSIHVLGRASCSTGQVTINERYALDQRYTLHSLLATLVHELTHIQGGEFCEGDPDEFESKTQAVAIEILGAMCNYGDRLACHAFYNEVEGILKATAYLIAIEHNWQDFYFTINALFFQNREQEMASQKSWRYWSQSGSRRLTLSSILRRYHAKVLYDYLLPGLTGKPVPIAIKPQPSYIMPGYNDTPPFTFDDTQSLIPHWIITILSQWATDPHEAP
jgi:hypothetical protein